ncbi:TPA: hypothetical protein OUH25_002592 [Escherichia coli]|nr:hypothetical protein [Escherichia coli]
MISDRFDGPEPGDITGLSISQMSPTNQPGRFCGIGYTGYHPQYDTELPWFEHTDDRLTEHGQQCPYVRPERREIQLIKRLQQFVPDALPVVRKASWHCRQCHHDYYGERYCTHCQTGGFSLPRTAQQLS